jgi:hypothetical protein
MEPTGRLTGSFGDYKITLKSGQVLLSGTKLKFEVPVSDMTLPENIVCEKVSANIASVVCTKDEKCLRLPSGVTKQKYTGWVYASFTFTSGQSQAGEKIVFNLLNVENSPSTKPTQLANVTLYDPLGL